MPALSEAERIATAPFANLGPAAQGFLRVPLQHLLAAQHPGYGDPWGVGTIRLTDLDPITGESTAPENHTSIFDASPP